MIIVFLPRFWKREALTETNRDWLRLRRGELDGQPEILERDAALQYIEDGANSLVHQPELASSNFKWDWIIVVALVPMILLVYQRLGGWEDEKISRILESSEFSEPDALDRIIQRIELRSNARPKNADYNMLLAEYHSSKNNLRLALFYFNRLIDQGLTSPEILGSAAQIEFLSSQRVLTPRAQSRAERALALDPNQGAALATLGMSAFESRRYGSAIEYWTRLRLLETPGSAEDLMLTEVIDSARSKRDALEIPDQPLSKGVLVTAKFPERSDLPSDSIVFILARPEGSRDGVPLAVNRISASESPFLAYLNDQNSMIGQRISDHARVNIEIQVSPSGLPGRENASWIGVSENAPVGGTDPIEVVLQRTMKN